VDFDGTLAHYDHYDPPEHIGGIIEENEPRKNLEKLKERGHIVIIWTCRYDTGPVKDFLEKNDIPFDHINENPYQSIAVSEAKMRADHYIDNRNACYEGLSEAVHRILEKD